MKLIQSILFISAALTFYIGLTAMTFGHDVDEATDESDLQLFCNDVSELDNFLNSELCMEVRGEL